jgi:hypothetical protein
MKKTLLAVAAMFLSLNAAHAASTDVWSPDFLTLKDGEQELGDILTPAQIEQDILESGDLGDDIDLTPTADGPRLKIVVSKAIPQHLTVYEDGVATMSWPVSTGAKGYGTPSGTFTVKRMHFTYTSRKYNARMDRAIFFNGGIALHQTYGNNIRLLGTPQSHGCVRQSPADGDRLFALVKKYGAGNTIVVVK